MVILDMFNIYRGEYESFLNGNISDFKKWLEGLSGEETYNFLKWLSQENLKII